MYELFLTWQQEWKYQSLVEMIANNIQSIQQEHVLPIMEKINEGEGELISFAKWLKSNVENDSVIQEVDYLLVNRFNLLH